MSAGTQIYPIRNQADYDKAMARINKIFSATPGTPKDFELDALVTLVDAYETKHFPISEASPIAMIEFRLDQQGMTRKDLEPLIGSRARVSEIMNGKRSLTLNMIRRLSAALQIPADFLIAPTGPEPRTRGVSPRAGGVRRKAPSKTKVATPPSGKRSARV